MITELGETVCPNNVGAELVVPTAATDGATICSPDVVVTVKDEVAGTVSGCTDGADIDDEMSPPPTTELTAAGPGADSELETVGC